MLSVWDHQHKIGSCCIILFESCSLTVHVMKEEAQMNVTLFHVKNKWKKKAIKVQLVIFHYVSLKHFGGGPYFEFYCQVYKVRGFNNRSWGRNIT